LLGIKGGDDNALHSVYIMLSVNERRLLDAVSALEGELHHLGIISLSEFFKDVGHLDSCINHDSYICACIRLREKRQAVVDAVKDSNVFYVCDDLHNPLRNTHVTKYDVQCFLLQVFTRTMKKLNDDITTFKLRHCPPGLPIKFSVLFDDDTRVLLKSFFKLGQDSMAAIVDLHKVPDWRSKDVKIVLNFLNQQQLYWCKFKCGLQEIVLLGLGKEKITFAGFTKVKATNQVKRFRLEDGQSGDPAFEIIIRRAIPKPKPLSNRPSDVVDGPCRVHEREEPSAEMYYTNNNYDEGEKLMHLYILFNTEDVSINTVV